MPLRVLVHLALHEHGLCSIGEAARTRDIAHNHLMKVVQLGRDDFVEMVRGRAGCIRLGRAAETITVGEVVRRAEEGFELAECSDCMLSPACGLTGILAQGMAAMLQVFDSNTIADIPTDKTMLRRLIAKGLPAASAHIENRRSLAAADNGSTIPVRWPSNAARRNNRTYVRCGSAPSAGGHHRDAMSALP